MIRRVVQILHKLSMAVNGVKINSKSHNRVYIIEE